MWILRRLAELGVSVDYLLETYNLRIRVHIEQNAPLWMFSLSKTLSKKIENLQKTALYIILGKHSHRDYYCNLAILDMETLDQRRNLISRNFAKKTLLHPEHKKMFKTIQCNTRSGKRVIIPKSQTARYRKSTIPALAEIINKELKDKL